MPSPLDAWATLDTAKHKATLYRQWHAGHHAGLTHPQALGVIAPPRGTPAVAKARDALLGGTRRGAAIASVLRDRGDLFLPFEAALLRLGEESGALEDCLRLLADYFTAEHRLILWLKRKMAYPLFTAVAACFIAPFPLFFFGRTTEYLVVSLGSVTLLLLFSGAILAAASRYYGRKPKFVRARLLRALATGVEAGLSLDRTVDLAVAAAASPALSAHVARAGGARREQSLADTFRGAPMLPGEMIAAMEVADTTGNYSDTLRRLADLYES